MDEAVDEAKQRKHHNGLFLIACARGLMAEAQTLLDMGAQPGTADKGGMTSAHFAAAHGKHDMLDFLWSKGVELDGEDPAGRTPLHLAALGGHRGCVSALLDRGAWADAFDATDNSALHLAARAGQLAAVEALLAGRAKTNVRNARGLTPLGEALAAGHTVVADTLASDGADACDRPRRYSLLHVAAGAAQLESVRWLLERGAAVNDFDNEEAASPLHCAALAGSTDCTRLLMDRGADTAALDIHGRTAAQLVNGETPAAKALLAALGCKAATKPFSAAARHETPMALKGTSAAAQSPAEAFLALSEKDQLKRVQRWVEDFPVLQKGAADAIAAFAPEVQERIVHAANADRTVNIYKALAALHQDEDFQQDLLRLPLQRVIDDTKKNPANYEKHVQNPDIARALEKIRRFHAVVKANGGTTVDLIQMAAGDMKTVEARDRQKLEELSTLHSAHLHAVCAAARTSAQGAAAAKDAATAAFSAEWEPVRRERRAAALANAGSAPAPLAVPLDDSNAAAEVAAMANVSPLSWESFKREAQRQGVQFLLMVVVALVTMFFLGIGPFEPGGVLSKEGFANLFGASAAAAPVDAGRSEL